jgi:hypothetical protein
LFIFDQEIYIIMKKSINLLFLILISCKPNNNLVKDFNYDFKYSSSIFSNHIVFEKISYDSKTGIYNLTKKENIDEKFSTKTIQIKLDENSKKEIYNSYNYLKPIKLYNCFYDTSNGELLEKTFISFYHENNYVDSTTCYNFKENKKMQDLNAIIINKLKSTKAYKEAFYWEFYKK